MIDKPECIAELIAWVEQNFDCRVDTSLRGEELAVISAVPERQNPEILTPQLRCSFEECLVDGATKLAWCDLQKIWWDAEYKILCTHFKAEKP